MKHYIIGFPHTVLATIPIAIRIKDINIALPFVTMVVFPETSDSIERVWGSDVSP
jgi:hypothetical protein